MSQQLQMHGIASTMILAALLCLASVSSAAEGNAHFDMSGWRQYLANQLDPGLAVVDLQRHPVASAAFDWKNAARSKLLPDFAHVLLDQKQPGLTTYNLSGRSAALNVWSSSGIQRPVLQLSGLQQQFYEPGLAARLSQNGYFSFGVVLAQQQYGNTLLDQQASITGNFQRGYYDRMNRINEALSSPFSNNTLLASKGMGMSFGYTYSVMPRLELQTSYRTKIDTESAYHAIGLYADPAELDLPARIGAAVKYALAPKHTLSVGVDRVQYSNVNSFISSLLPSNLLSLLGDSTSPAFIWSDLNIYRASWNYQPADTWNLQLEYTTRTQPLPQSTLLANTLRTSLADHSYGFYASKRLGSLSNLSLGVTYAPVDLNFGGSSLGIVTDDLSNNFEFDLRLNFTY